MNGLTVWLSGSGWIDVTPYYFRTISEKRASLQTLSRWRVCNPSPPRTMTRWKQTKKDVFEDLVERDAAYIPASGFIQIRIDMLVELFFG